MCDARESGERGSANASFSGSGMKSWWERGEHCVDGICIFSSGNYSRGLVLVTTHQNAHLVAGFPHEVELLERSEPPPYQLVDIPGKGAGLVATRVIHKGEYIMARTPSIMVQSIGHVEIETNQLVDLYEAATQYLPEDARQHFMRQFGPDIYSKIELNSFNVPIERGQDSGMHLGIYPDVSRFNHDCRPKQVFQETLV